MKIRKAIFMGLKVDAINIANPYEIGTEIRVKPNPKTSDTQKKFPWMEVKEGQHDNDAWVFANSEIRLIPEKEPDLNDWL